MWHNNTLGKADGLTIICVSINWPLGNVVVFWKCDFRTHIKDYVHEQFLWNGSQVMPQNIVDDK